MTLLPSFAALGLSNTLLTVLSKKGFEEPTPIQRDAIPRILNEEGHLIGRAQTGTGKTVAFGIPLVERIDPKTDLTQALILTPTRELALQVSNEISELRAHRKLGVVPIYGGQSMGEQIIRLRSAGSARFFPPHIVVGTPGRVLDHLSRKTLNLSEVKFLVLDEADEMLSMGFIDDIEVIMSHTPRDKRIFLFSATMPRGLSTIIQKHLPEHTLVAPQSIGEPTSAQVSQTYIELSSEERFDALCRIIDMEEQFYGIVFCRTRVEVSELQNRLGARGYRAESLSGDSSQAQREKSLSRFRDRTSNILAATDVAARGIDIKDVTHVINYSLPQSPEAYVHRIGRTGRGGKSGEAITFILPSERRRLFSIRHHTKSEIKERFLPGAQDIVETKINKIQKSLDHIIDQEEHQLYMRLASEFLKAKDPATLVAAILRHAFEDELDENRYLLENAKRQSKGPVKHGRMHLFFGMGLSQEMTPESVRDLLEESMQMELPDIQDVKIFDRHTLFSVPLDIGLRILEVFEGPEGRKVLVRPAYKKPQFNNKSPSPRRKSAPRS